MLLVLIKSLGIMGAAIAFTVRITMDYYILSYLLNKVMKLPKTFYKNLLLPDNSDLNDIKNMFLYNCYNYIFQFYI